MACLTSRSSIASARMFLVSPFQSRLFTTAAHPRRNQVTRSGPSSPSATRPHTLARPATRARRSKASPHTRCGCGISAPGSLPSSRRRGANGSRGETPGTPLPCSARSRRRTRSAPDRDRQIHSVNAETGNRTAATAKVLAISPTRIKNGNASGPPNGSPVSTAHASSANTLPPTAPRRRRRRRPSRRQASERIALAHTPTEGSPST
jgi:hypothetical protein